MEKKNESDKPAEQLAALVKPLDILIVDDVLANRFLVETMLSGSYVCEGAGSAAEMWRM